MKRRYLRYILIGCILITIVITSFYFGLFPLPSYSNADFNIANYQSAFDEDSDGVDNQTDILLNAKKYINTKPKYKSAYYGSGYPDDGYGVCTDVVAFALKDSGFDLMWLVYYDVKANPDQYSIDIIDKKIDFRRVKNLRVFFKNYAQSLTTNIYEIDQWQGGDIVIFKGHIGIVSDKRNRQGVPYLIHHSSPYQLRYEEDVLSRYDDIVGHYRIP